MMRREMDDIERTQIKSVEVKNVMCEMKNTVDKINSNSVQKHGEKRRINTYQLIS